MVQCFEPPPPISQMREIVYCVHGELDYGAPHYFLPAIWLKRAGHKVKVYCQGDQRIQECGKGEISVHGLGTSTIRFLANLSARLARARKGGVLFYIHGHVSACAAFLALPGIRPTQLLYHSQDFLEPGRHPHWEVCEKKVARRAATVIWNEINRARFAASHYRLKKLPTVVPSYLPRDWPESKCLPHRRKHLLTITGLQGVSDAKLIIHQGGFAQVRCGRELVNSLALLPRNYGLIFTGMDEGSSAHRDLLSQLRALGIENRVVAIGRLPHTELQEVTASCDVGILLYPNDGIGNFYQCPGRLTQYLKCGVPVVLSASPNLELLAMKYSIGDVCDPTSAAEIAAALQRNTSSRQAGMYQSDALRALARNVLCYDLHAHLIDAAVNSPW